MYEGQQVGVLSMEFLHDGRPPVIRDATYAPPPVVDAAGPGSGPAGASKPH